VYTRARRPPLLSLSPTSPRPNERAAAPGTRRYRPSTVLPPPPAPPWHSSLASDPKGRGLSRRALPCRPRAISRRSRGGFRGELGCIRAGLRASAGVSRRCRCRAPRPSPGPPPLAAPKAFLDLAPRTTSPRTAGSACRARSLGGCGQLVRAQPPRERTRASRALPLRWAVRSHRGCAPTRWAPLGQPPLGTPCAPRLCTHEPQATDLRAQAIANEPSQLLACAKSVAGRHCLCDLRALHLAAVHAAE